MTPEARLAAAAEILDRALAGEAAEKVLTTWARRSRFAGSKDRAAIRDHVFDAIRRRRSVAHLGGSETGRGLVIGLLRSQGMDPAEFLTGEGHALPPLTEAEAPVPPEPAGNVALDCPDWLEGELRDSLGGEFDQVMERLRHRADLFLRVNNARTDVAAARSALEAEEILSQPHPFCQTALLVTEGARKVQGSRAYADGLVEIQDLASQAVAAAVDLPGQGKLLDYCAGGGGKALALAARGAGSVFVHDADPARMKDLPARAERAGADLRPLDSKRIDQHAPFALVVVDVPCSGSGAWRRQPEAKWQLTQEALDHFVAVQAGILDRAASLVAPGGTIAYMTCSLLRCENEAQRDAFLARHPGWRERRSLRLSPLQGGDGFFLAMLEKSG